MLSAVKYGIKRFIYISSGAVYGNLSNRQSKETDNLTPISNYGLSKVISETIVLFYARKYNIIPVIIRIPHVYGNGKNSGIIHNFYTSINKYGYISLDGDGQQGRNFLHIDDLCDSLYAILISKISGIYNITNSAKVTVNKVVEYFSKCIPFKIKSSKRGVITNMNLYLDGTKLTKLLGVVNKRSIWDYIRGLYGA